MESITKEVNLLPQLEKACGLDIHKDTIVGFISDKDGRNQEFREFGTFTCQLHEVKDWLLQHGVQHCLMESTGIYWMSLYMILSEAGIKVTIANPTHIKQIPKRKTDRKDARWLCTLLLHGLVRPSFMPDAQQITLRDYCRSRLHYNWQQTKTLNRIVKLLECNNIKLKSVVSSMRTKTAMSIVRLLAAGVTDKVQLLSCARGRVKSKKDRLLMALEGTLTQSHCIQIQMLLADFDHAQKQLDFLNTAIATVIEEYYVQEFECLDSISGIGVKSAEIILSEVGKDMTRFPSADHLTAWCGVAPGNNESAGKRRNTAVKKGNTYLKTAIITAAWVAVRMKDSYWSALFAKLRKRMIAQKAIVAIARKLLKVVYKTICNLTRYEEKGVAHFIEVQLYNRMRAQQKLR